MAHVLREQWDRGLAHEYPASLHGAGAVVTDGSGGTKKGEGMSDTLSFEDIHKAIEHLRSLDAPEPMQGERCAFCGSHAVFEANYIHDLNPLKVTTLGKRCFVCFAWAKKEVPHA